MFVCSMFKLIIRNCCLSLNLSKRAIIGLTISDICCMRWAHAYLVALTHLPAHALATPTKKQQGRQSIIDITLAHTTCYRIDFAGIRCSFYHNYSKSAHFHGTCLIIEHYKKHSQVLGGRCLSIAVL